MAITETRTDSDQSQGGDLIRTLLFMAVGASLLIVAYRGLSSPFRSRASWLR